MLTKIAKKLLSYQKADVFVPNFHSNAPSATFIPIKGSGGTERWGGLNFGGFSTNFISSITESGQNASFGFAFGTGTTAPTEDDYTIESIISSGLSMTGTPQKQYSFNSETDEYTVYYDITLANSSESDISISEVCHFANVFPTANKGEAPVTNIYNYFSVLMDRIVLEIPVVIPAGESGVIRYSMIY